MVRDNRLFVRRELRQRPLIAIPAHGLDFHIEFLRYLIPHLSERAGYCCLPGNQKIYDQRDEKFLEGAQGFVPSCAGNRSGNTLFCRSRVSLGIEHRSVVSRDRHDSQRRVDAELDGKAIIG